MTQPPDAVSPPFSTPTVVHANDAYDAELGITIRARDAVDVALNAALDAVLAAVPTSERERLFLLPLSPSKESPPR